MRDETDSNTQPKDCHGFVLKLHCIVGVRSLHRLLRLLRGSTQRIERALDAETVRGLSDARLCSRYSHFGRVRYFPTVPTAGLVGRRLLFDVHVQRRRVRSYWSGGAPGRFCSIGRAE